MQQAEILGNVGGRVASTGAGRRGDVTHRHSRRRRRTADRSTSADWRLERRTPLHCTAEVPARVRAGVAEPALVQPTDAKRGPGVRWTEAADRAASLDDLLARGRNRRE